MTATVHPSSTAAATTAAGHHAAAGKGSAHATTGNGADAFSELMEALAAFDPNGTGDAAALPDASTTTDRKPAAAGDDAATAPGKPPLAAGAAVPLPSALPAAMLAIANAAPAKGQAASAPASAGEGAGTEAIGGTAKRGRPTAAASEAQVDTALAAPAADGFATKLHAAKGEGAAAAAPGLGAASSGDARPAAAARAAHELAPAFALHAPAPVLPDAGAAPGAPVHQAALPSHPLDAAFGGDLAAEVQVMAQSGVQRAELRLNPADLGPVRIELALTAQTADIQFTAAHATTREGIEQALPQLRELLASSGLQLGQAGVGAGTGGQAGAESAWRERAPDAHPASGAGGRRGAIGGDLPAGAGVTAVAVRRGRGMLDLYA
jgi:flagellar hook-length control protein FliK